MHLLDLMKNQNYVLVQQDEVSILLKVYILIFIVFSKDRCQRHNVLPIAYLNMSLPRIEGTATLMTLSQLKEMFFAVCINRFSKYY